MSRLQAGPGSEELQQPDARSARLIRELVEYATGVDGVAALSGHVLDALAILESEPLAGEAAHRDRTTPDTPRPDGFGPDAVPTPQVSCLLVPLAGAVSGDAASPGGLRGAAVWIGSDPAELVVHPGHRRQGLGITLVRTALEHTAAVWAHGDLPAARSLASRLGLSRSRELLQMGRSLGSAANSPSDELPPVRWPDGVSVRPFRPGQDDDAFLTVNARAFAWHPEQGRLDAAGLALEMAHNWFDPDGFLLAVDADDTVLGFHWTKVHPADPAAGTPSVGEVYVLAVDPQSPIRRLGRPLTLAGLEYLRDQRGMGAVMLYVEGDNEPALALYRGLGFQVSRTDVVYRFLQCRP